MPTHFKLRDIAPSPLKERPAMYEQGLLPCLPARFKWLEERTWRRLQDQAQRLDRPMQVILQGD